MELGCEIKGDHDDDDDNVLQCLKSMVIIIDEYVSLFDSPVMEYGSKLNDIE